MNCPRCNTRSEVLETRGNERRRKCLSLRCGHRWTTVEISTAELGQIRAGTVRLLQIRVTKGAAHDPAG